MFGLLGCSASSDTAARRRPKVAKRPAVKKKKNKKAVREKNTEETHAKQQTDVHARRCPPCLPQMPVMTVIPFKYASDCSGIEAGMTALERMAVLPTRHLWASDVNHKCRQMFAFNFDIEQIYDDVFAKPEGLEQPDLYTAGFPCQPYSNQGKQSGHNDPRSMVVWGVISTIRNMLPKTFILENLPTLCTDKHGDMFDLIVRELTSIMDRNQRAYDVHIKTLNSLHHGVPQNRLRLYFVGILRRCEQCAFAWPSETVNPPTLDSVLSPDDGTTHSLPKTATALRGIAECIDLIVKRGGNPFTEPWVGNVLNCPAYGPQVMKTSCHV